MYSELLDYTENVFESTENSIQVSHLLFSSNCPLDQSGMYPAAATLLQRQTPLSSLWLTGARIWESPCWHDQEVLNYVGTSDTKYGYFSEGVCSSPIPDILHHSQATGSAVLSVGKSTGRRLWAELLQRASQKGCDLLPQKSNLEQHIHCPLDTSHIFSGGFLCPKRQQRGTSWETSTNAFHLWDFHTWHLLVFLHNHLFSVLLQSPLNHNLEDR